MYVGWRRDRCFCRPDCATLKDQSAGDRAFFDPAIPKAWPGFKLTFRHGAATYACVVDNAAGTGHGIARVELDGKDVDPLEGIPLTREGEHSVCVVIGAGKSADVGSLES